MASPGEMDISSSPLASAVPILCVSAIDHFMLAWIGYCRTSLYGSSATSFSIVLAIAPNARGAPARSSAGRTGATARRTAIVEARRTAISLTAPRWLKELFFG